jgi:hypothetical protein
MTPPSLRNTLRELLARLLESAHPAQLGVAMMAGGVLALVAWAVVQAPVAISLHPIVSALYGASCVAVAGIGAALLQAVRKRTRQQARGTVDRRRFAAQLTRRLDERRWTGDARRDDHHIAGGVTLLRELRKALRTDAGEIDHVAVLSAAGAVAGFACSMSARSQCQGQLTIQVRRGPDGARYYFGAPITELLWAGTDSVYAMAVGGARAAAVGAPADHVRLAALDRHVAASIGTGAFGVPRLPPLFTPAAMPVDYARASLDAVLAISMRYARSRDDYWRIAAWAVFGACASARGVLSARMALRIIMESAAPCSCIDPERIVADDADASSAARAAARVRTVLAAPLASAA